MNLCSKKNMIFWEKVEDASEYVIHLFIESKIIHTRNHFYDAPPFIPKFLESKHKTQKEGDIVLQEIDTISISREKTYYTFNDLVSIKNDLIDNTNYSSGMNYHVYVVAEDRQGNEIDKSGRIILDF